MSNAMDKEQEDEVKKQRSQNMILAGLCMANNDYDPACNHLETFEWSIDRDHPAAKELKEWHTQWHKETDALRQEMRVANLRRGYFERQDAEEKFEQDYQKLYAKKYMRVCQEVGLHYGLVNKE